MIDLSKARELLKAAMETQGRDFVYSPGGHGCFYTPITELPAKYTRPGGDRTVAEDDPRRKTGCLIGVALNLHGETRHHGYESRVTNLALDFPDIMDSQARDYFQRAQSGQDYGLSWGQAYDSAETFAEVYLLGKQPEGTRF